jgi:hypothetical protein
VGGMSILRNFRLADRRSQVFFCSLAFLGMSQPIFVVASNLEPRKTFAGSNTYGAAEAR